MAAGGVTHAGKSNWDCFSRDDCKDKAVSLLIGIALTAIAGVAAYYLLVHGLTMYDTALTSLEVFGSGFMIYSGAVFTFVAVGNILYTGCKHLCHSEKDDKPFEYTCDEAKWQIAISVFAPIVAIPALVCLGIGGAMK